MRVTTRRRPLRLWIAALLNIAAALAAALLSLALLAFLATSSRVPEASRPSVLTAVVPALLSGLLVLTTIWAMLGRRHGGVLMLLAAVAFYGLLVTQNVLLLGQPHDALGPNANINLTTNAVRGALAIAINGWALLSAKTRRYFVGEI